MKNLAIIPARGGSKRIPGKNIKDFLGKPIIAYSIETALNCGLFDEIMVSTDDEQIAKIATEYGATIPFLRNADTANDYATLADVVDEVIAKYQNIGKYFDLICCILPTAPFITAEALQKGYSLIQQIEVDSVRPVVRFYYPIQRALRMTEDGNLQLLQSKFSDTRSQDLEPAFHDAGQFYWMKSQKCMRGQNKYGFEISEMTAQDIDNEEDWKLAELKYRFLHINE